MLFRIEIDFEEHRPIREIKLRATRQKELETKAHYVAKEVLLRSVKKFHEMFPDEMDSYFIVYPIDNDVAFIYNPKERPDFRDLVRYGYLNVDSSIELWDMVGSYADSLGINEYTVKDRDNTYLYHVNFNELPNA